ncbi:MULTISPECIES: recombinase family protein [unclassified Streptomyces]|uniref:recombinase family protein n=1 Tax=unclassified Streptomyces TaxID=2593676 RepID=UPI0003726D6B|nr:MULTISPECIES: recombinase family protein [unclassified Streptomyces]MYY03041.1 recombinase family protein [Streptomyces sp. SID4913]
MTQSEGEDPSLLIDLFCRKSRAKASKGKREISISAQETRGRLIADRLGLTVRHVWREVGSASRFRTGKKARTDQDAALRALERGEVGALWVFRLDRWDRRGAGAILRIIEPADGRPRRILFDNGDPDNPGVGLDSSNPRDRKELIRRAEDAREETEVLSERVRNTKTHQRANGEWVNHSAPYGLKVVLVEVEDEDGDLLVERKLALDDAPAAQGADAPSKANIAFKVAYELPVQKESGRAIAQAMNRAHIPSPSGGEWAHATVRDMVRNPAYAGWQTTGRQDGRSRRVLFRDEAGRRVSVMHGPALLTDEQQTEAIAAMRGTDGRGVSSAGPHDTRAKYLLTGLLMCGGCGGPMSFSGTGYRCWKPAAGKTCPAPASVVRHLADAFVHHRWEARLAGAEPDDPLVYAVAERWAARVQPVATEESRAALEALTAAEKALSRVWADRKAGLYEGPSEAFFAPALREVTEDVVAAKKRVEATTARRGVDVSFLLDPAMCEGAWEAADGQLRRTLLRLAIDSVTVTKARSRGVMFDGWKQTRFKWADGEED